MSRQSSGSQSIQKGRPNGMRTTNLTVAIEIDRHDLLSAPVREPQTVLCANVAIHPSRDRSATLPLAVAKTGWTASQPPEVRARMMGDSFVAHRIDPRPASRDTRSLRVHQSVTRVPRIATLNDHDEE